VRVGVVMTVLLLAASCGEDPTPPPDQPPMCEQPLDEACAGAVCGAKTNRCGLGVSCGTCPTGLTCTADGRCEPPQQCVPDTMAACAGRECGEAPDGCGATVTCGTCTIGACGATGRCELPPPPIECPALRAEQDRPDDSTLPQVRMMYVIPSDAPDELLDVNGRVCQSARGFSEWLRAQLGSSGLRFDTAAGLLDIGFYRLAKTNAEMRGSSNDADVDVGYAYVRERLERELRAAGLVPPDKVLAVFYGGESRYACGGAFYPPALLGSVVAMYLKSTIGGVACQARPWGQPTGLGYYDWAMLHDLLHGLGIVAEQAPHQHTSGHTYDAQAASPETDLMYSPRPNTMDPYWGIDAPAGLVLDLGHDDYFSHDAGFVDLKRSAFLQPLPMNAQRPPGW
jgi:hypothetical protein